MALALAGLDAGTAFGGMGASRAMTIGALAEPALLVAVLALSLQAGTSNLPGIVTATLARPELVASPARVLALAALVIVVVAETGRIPVDNPSTHLELTMIHEAMVLEYAGPELALVTLGGQMRLGLLLSLVANLFFPWGICRRRRAECTCCWGWPCWSAKTARDRRGDRGRTRSRWPSSGCSASRRSCPPRSCSRCSPWSPGWPCRDRIRLSREYSAWRPGPCSPARW